MGGGLWVEVYGWRSMGGGLLVEVYWWRSIGESYDVRLAVSRLVMAVDSLGSKD